MLRVQLHWLAAVCRGHSCHGNWAARLRSHWGDNRWGRLVGSAEAEPGRRGSASSQTPWEGHPRGAAGRSVALLGLNGDRVWVTPRGLMMPTGLYPVPRGSSRNHRLASERRLVAVNVSNPPFLGLTLSSQTGSGGPGSTLQWRVSGAGGNSWLVGDPGGQDGADTTAGRRLRAGPCEGSRRECSLRSGVAVWGSGGAQGRGSSGLSGDHDEQKAGAWPNRVAELSTRWRCGEDCRPSGLGSSSFPEEARNLYLGIYIS